MGEKKFEDAIMCFKRALQQGPCSAFCAYNIACGYSQLHRQRHKDDKEAGIAGKSTQYHAELSLRWFQLCVVWNYPNPDWAANDPQLSVIRKAPRFASLLDQLRDNLARLRDDNRRRGLSSSVLEEDERNQDRAAEDGDVPVVGRDTSKEVPQRVIRS